MSKSQNKKEAKGIHELREAGEHKRFVDEMQYFLDGLAPSQPINIRRNTSLALVKKVSNPHFLVKIKTYDYISRLLPVLLVEDPVLAILGNAMLWFLSQDQVNSEVLSRNPRILPFISFCLGNRYEPKSKYDKRFVRRGYLIYSFMPSSLLI